MIQIRRMQAKDTDAVARLEKEIFSQPWSSQGFLDAINLDNTVFLVAEEKDAIIGYVGMYLSIDEGEITNVAVSKESRRRRVGDRLLKELLAIGREKGISHIVLEVRVSNTAAIRLYEQNGFTLCGTRRGFYEFPKEDAYVMTHDN